MRNLKRALSLGLTAAMISGLMVMGSSAASYADVTSEDNQEAIEVLQAVEIMVGDENGDFNPDQNVTRNEMAVIMSNLMEYNVASYKNTSPFTDVPAWAEPYVAACWTNGITAGYSDTIYGGSDTVTTAQAALMLMKALGYFQYASDFGSDWQLATTRQGNAIDLFVGVDSGVTQAMTRNDVAQLVLNTLKSGTVQAETNGSLTVGNVTIATDVKYNYITSNQTYANAISSDKSTSNTTDANRSIVELGEKLYNGDLKLDEDTTDVFGRPARTWSYEGEEIGTFAQKELLAAEFTTAVSGKELYDVVGKTAYDKYDFESYVDGEENDFYKEIARNNRGDIDETGNGALTQVFVDTDDEFVTVTIINTYLAQATSDYNEKKDTINFEIYGLSSANGSVSGEDFDIVDLLADDFVLVTYAKPEKEIQSISDVEIISNTNIDRFSAGKGGSLTVDGTKYNYSETATYDPEVLEKYTVEGGAVTNLKDTTYNVYLDQYGYAIGVDIVDKVDNYVFITGVDSNSSNLANKTWDASAIFLDGTCDVIEVKNNGEVEPAPVVNSWYTYTVSNSDVYTLTKVNDSNPVLSDDDDKYDIGQKWSNASEANKKIDAKHISLQGIDTDTRVYGNEDTIYLLGALDKVTKSDGSSGDIDYTVINDVDEVVTGVENAAFELYTWAEARKEAKATNGTANETNTSSGAYGLYGDDGYLIAVVVVGESSSVAKDVAYVISDDIDEESYDRSTELWTWTREVIIDGESVMLTEQNDTGVSVLDDSAITEKWVTVNYDANGFVKSVDVFTDADEEYAEDILTAVEKVEDDEDLVVVQVANEENHEYTLKGSTLYDETSAKLGFLVASDVNVVLKQEVDSKTETTYDTGVDTLKSILEDLNEDGADYEFNAIIEDGRATTIIILDETPDQDHDSPTGGDTPDGYSAEVNISLRRVTVTGPDAWDQDDVATTAVNALAELGYEVTDMNYEASPWVFTAKNTDSGTDNIKFTVAMAESK